MVLLRFAAHFGFRVQVERERESFRRVLGSIRSITDVPGDCRPFAAGKIGLFGFPVVYAI